jgi:hypothetical protein
MRKFDNNPKTAPRILAWFVIGWHQAGDGFAISLHLELAAACHLVWHGYFIAILESVAKNPVKKGAQTRSKAWLKRHGTQVWKPAIRQAGKPALQWFAMVLPVSL